MPRPQTYPVISAKVWWSLRDRIVNSPPKGDVKEYMASALGMSEKAVANTVPSLRQLGLIDEKNKITDLASRWRDDLQYADVCREIVERVYPVGLRDASPIEDPDLEAASRWFFADIGSRPLRAKQLAIFYTMLARGDLPGRGDGATRRRSEAAGTVSRPVRKVAAGPRGQALAKRPKSDEDPQKLQAPPMPTLSIAIQVYVDKDMTADQVDHVFASMAHHLYGRE